MLIPFSSEVWGYVLVCRRVLLTQGFIVVISLLSACSIVPEAEVQTFPQAKPDYTPLEPDLATANQAHTAVAVQDIAFKANAPKRYVVQKGDTLWGIAQKFLHDPWFWPEVWDKNQKVRNPHLIYPGDVLYIHYVGRKLGRPGEKLLPRIRVDRKGIGDPLSTLASFLFWPQVVDEEVLNRAPYVVASQDDHLLIENEARVYIKRLADKQHGQRYGIFHKNKPIYDIDPETKAQRLLGYEVAYNGELRVKQPGDLATGEVIDTEREIRPGDYLLPRHNTLNLNVPISVPRHQVDGEIIALYDAELIEGEYMIAVINKGAQEHIEVGHTLGIMRPGQIVKDPYDQHDDLLKQPVKLQLPTEKVGHMVVYQTYKHLSYALIVDAHYEVKIGYGLANP